MTSREQERERERGQRREREEKGPPPPSPPPTDVVVISCARAAQEKRRRETTRASAGRWREKGDREIFSTPQARAERGQEAERDIGAETRGGKERGR